MVPRPFFFFCWYSNCSRCWIDCWLPLAIHRISISYILTDGISTKFD
ncbi:unnamed protein product [Tenebrio molitor]|nr:unnamed protein product [Tenebrio molitor]